MQVFNSPINSKQIVIGTSQKALSSNVGFYFLKFYKNNEEWFSENCVLNIPILYFEYAYNNMLNK